MILVSAVIFIFLLWLLYLREPVSTESGLNVGFLPPLNAFLNALSALCLAAGYVAIRNKNRKLHQKLMLSALGFSAAFLVRDRKSTRLNSSHSQQSRMPSSA